MSVNMLFWCILVFVVGSVCSAPNFNINNSQNNTRHARQIEVNRNHCNCACGTSKYRGRVIGGTETRPHEFPWLAGYSYDGVFRCGASLITRRHLLTAAHCVHGFDISKMKISLSEHDRSLGRDSKSIKRRVIQAKTHEGFDPRTYNNDIAVLELDEPVDFNNDMRPACLPKNSDVDYSHYMATVAGWGKIEEQGDLSQVPLKLDVPIWSRRECLDASGYQISRITENMFCAGYKEGGRDACQGDSGGPLHVASDAGNMEIIGLVSWGRGCARPKLPGLYTKVVNYLDWIEESLNGECMCSPSRYLSRQQ